MSWSALFRTAGQCGGLYLVVLRSVAYICCNKWYLFLCRKGVGGWARVKASAAMEITPPPCFLLLQILYFGVVFRWLWLVG